MKMLISIPELDSRKSRDLIPLECLHCGKTHYRTKNIVLRVLNGNHQNTLKNGFCSKKCGYDYRKTSRTYSCKICGKSFERIPSEVSKNMFCSKSCSAQFNNQYKIIYRKCRNCYEEFHSSQGTRAKYCSKKCQMKFQRTQIYKLIESGKYYATRSGNDVLRNYLISKRGHQCELCKNENWMGNKINLTTHHMDGDASNNNPSNLQLLCWNCHSMTENYGCHNLKSTRNYRYKNGASSENQTQSSTLPK